MCYYLQQGDMPMYIQKTQIELCRHCLPCTVQSLLMYRQGFLCPAAPTCPCPTPTRHTASHSIQLSVKQIACQSNAPQQVHLAHVLQWPYTQSKLPSTFLEGFDLFGFCHHGLLEFVCLFVPLPHGKLLCRSTGCRSGLRGAWLMLGFTQVSTWGRALAESVLHPTCHNCSGLCLASEANHCLYLRSPSRKREDNKKQIRYYVSTKTICSELLLWNASVQCDLLPETSLRYSIRMVNDNITLL